MSCLVKITKCTSELLSEELFVGFDFKNSTVQNRVKWTIDHKNLANFTNNFFVPELASSLFDNAVKTLCAKAQAHALPEQQ